MRLSMVRAKRGGVQTHLGRDPRRERARHVARARALHGGRRTGGPRIAPRAAAAVEALSRCSRPSPRRTAEPFEATNPGGDRVRHRFARDSCDCADTEDPRPRAKEGWRVGQVEIDLAPLRRSPPPSAVRPRHHRAAEREVVEPVGRVDRDHSRRGRAMVDRETRSGGRARPFRRCRRSNSDRMG